MVESYAVAHAQTPVDYQVALARKDLMLHGPSFQVTPDMYSFGHLAAYPASYYTYLVCNVFAGNLLHHCWKPSLSGAPDFKDKLLRFGGTRDPLQLLSDCCGPHDPFDLTHFHDQT